MSEGRVSLIVNPRSGAGRTGRHLDEIKQLAKGLASDVEVRLTSGVGDGIRQAREAAEWGATRVVAVGGDGTINEVVNGLIQSERSDVVLGVVPGGTGSDLVRTLKVPSQREDALRLALSGVARPCDVMLGSFTRADGVRYNRYGINVIGMGMAGDVVQRVNAGSKRWGGTLTFLGATLASLASWEPAEVALKWVRADGREGEWQGLLMNAFVGNGQFCGGGIWLGPRGQIEDGLLELVIIPHMPWMTLLGRVPHLYTGRIAETPGVIWEQIRSVVASRVGGSDVPADVDGEQPGGIPLQIDVLERRLLISLS